MRRTVLAFLAGCVVTVAAVGITQSWLAASLSHISWKDLGTWVTDHKDEITAVGVLLAAVALGVNAWAARLAARTAKWNSTRDILWRFNEKWKELYDNRVRANATLEQMTKTNAYKYDDPLSEVLNHFDAMKERASAPVVKG